MGREALLWGMAQTPTRAQRLADLYRMQKTATGDEKKALEKELQAELGQRSMAAVHRLVEAAERGDPEL